MVAENTANARSRCLRDRRYERLGMRVGQSCDIHRRCYVQHHAELRRGAHKCLELQNDCSGIDGDRWRVLVLEEIPNRLEEMLTAESWWRARVQNEFERDEHWDRYVFGLRDRVPQSETHEYGGGPAGLTRLPFSSSAVPVPPPYDQSAAMRRA
jgi:hypothetical protein